MQYAIYLLVVTGNIAQRNGGVVRPAWVEDWIANSDDAPTISRYRIRSFFKECKEDGLLGFDGNQYIWRETHALNGLGNDVINAMELKR